jgi:HD-like signal output (HDOD) protein
MCYEFTAIFSQVDPGDREMDIMRQDLFEIVEKMPAFPQSVHRILELTSDIDSDPKVLVAVIQHDPILVMKILRLVNSPYFGLAQKISSINHAVVYIGINTVKNLALSSATLGVLPRTNAAGFDTGAFLLHSLGTAIIARILGKKLHVPEQEVFDYFVAGLLHDFGKIVLAHFMPGEFRLALEMARREGVRLYEAERAVLGTDHMQIGARLGEKWNLPPPVVSCLRNHHGGGNAGRSPLLEEAVVAADQIGKSLNIGFGGESRIEPLSAGITAALGMDVQEIFASLGDVSAEMERALVFIEP